MPRDLPSNITIPSFDAYQVRIVRDGHEYSATFAWSRYGSKDQALREAVVWRDAMLARLPPAATSLGSFRRTAQKNKRSYGRVGITRYIGVDRRKVGSPGYLRFAVNWVDGTGKPMVTSFQVGKVGSFTWEVELHGACTAEAFRTQWEYCQAMGHSFDPSRYEGWKTNNYYPFDPSLEDRDNLTQEYREADMPKYLMNPATGSVDTEENWLAEMPTWEGDQQAQFASLVEVVKHEDGQWVEVK